MLHVHPYMQLMFSNSLYLYIKYKRMNAVNSYAIEYMTIMCLKINWDKYMKFCTVCLKIFIIHHANMLQGGIRVNLTPKMRQSSLNVTPRSQMMPNFTFLLHKYDSKKRLNRQQVLLRLAPTLVKVNDLTPLRQEFSNSAPKIFGVEYTDYTLEYACFALHSFEWFRSVLK